MTTPVVLTDAQVYNGSPQLDCSDGYFTFRDKGRALVGTDDTKIPPGTVIKDVIGPGTIIMSKNALSAGSGLTIFFFRFNIPIVIPDAVRTNGLNLVTSATGVFCNDDFQMEADGTGFPAHTTVQSWGDGTLILSNPASGSGTAALTIQRYQEPPMFENDRLHDYRGDWQADKRRDYDRAHTLSQGSVDEFWTRLAKFVQDYYDSGAGGTDRVLINTMHMGDILAPSGGAAATAYAAAVTAFQPGGMAPYPVSGTNY